MIAQLHLKSDSVKVVNGVASIDIDTDKQGWGSAVEELVRVACKLSGQEGLQSRIFELLAAAEPNCKIVQTDKCLREVACGTVDYIKPFFVKVCPYFEFDFVGDLMQTCDGETCDGISHSWPTVSVVCDHETSMRISEAIHFAIESERGNHEGRRF